MLGAPVGSRVGVFTLYGEDGSPHLSTELLAPLSLLVMMSTNCEACAELIPRLRGLEGIVGGAPVWFVVESPANEFVPELSQIGSVLFDSDLSATTALRNRATPQAYLIGDGEVVVGRSIPGSLRDLRRLAGDAARRGGRHPVATSP